MQEGRKDVGCMCVCLPLGFVPCVCLLFGIDRAWQPCKLPPPVHSLSSCVPAESKWWEASGGDGAARKMPAGHVGAGEEPPVDSSTTCCCSGKLEEGRAQAKVLVGEAARAWRPPRGLPPHPGHALALLPPTWPPGYFPVPGQGQETGNTRWLPKNQWPVAHLVVIAK